MNLKMETNLPLFEHNYLEHPKESTNYFNLISRINNAIGYEVLKSIVLH